jgi:hypothetical protein
MTMIGYDMPLPPRRVLEPMAWMSSEDGDLAGRLAGQVAIVTGSSRGLGDYCALGFAREGAVVALAVRTAEEAVVVFIGGRPPHSLFVGEWPS